MRIPPIPEPRLRRVENRTLFDWFACDKMGVGRTFFDTLVVKGTFALASGKLQPAREQSPVALADQYWDTAPAERSSLRYAGEALLTKPSTDVLVTGTARPPGGEPLAAWDVGVVVRRRGEAVIDYRARVTGPRCWRHTDAKGWALIEPVPALEVPIRYELAYGGGYAAEPERPWIVHAPNPSGIGFCDERALDTSAEVRAPQWEPHGQPVTEINHEVALAGLGPVARPWSARIGYAGTYDAAWESAMRADVASGLPPDYAADFDPRFFQCAHPALIAPSYLEGDEEIELTGLGRGAGPLTFQLPGTPVGARLCTGTGTWHRERMRLDTVHIDLDAEEVFLCWRLTLDQGRDIRGAIIVDRARERPPAGITEGAASRAPVEGA